MGNGEANGMLAHLALNRKDNSSGLQYFEKSALANDRIGLYGMGMMYLHGVEVEKNASRALEYFIQAAELQHPAAAYQTGKAYLHGSGCKQNSAEAYRYFQQGSRLGQMQAMISLGLITLEGRAPVGSPDCARGVQLLKRVAESGDLKTVLAIASDEIDSGNVFLALYRYLQAAHAGLEVAQFNAALILEKSSLLASKLPNDGPAKDLRAPPSSYSSSPSPPPSVNDLVSGLWAEKDGDPGGFTPAHPLHKSDELMHWSRSRLHEEALALYDMSFRQGHIPAVLRAGHLAYTHIGDYEKAAEAYLSGSSVRCAECSFSVGMMHVLGLGVAADRKTALQYMERARTDSHEGAIPASIAITLMKFGWGLADLRARIRARKASESSGPDIHGLVDMVVVAVLSGILGIVWLARRKRMADADHPDAGEGEAVEAAEGAND